MVTLKVAIVYSCLETSYQDQQFHTVLDSFQVSVRNYPYVVRSRWERPIALVTACLTELNTELTILPRDYERNLGTPKEVCNMLNKACVAAYKSF